MRQMLYLLWVQSIRHFFAKKKHIGDWFAWSLCSASIPADPLETTSHWKGFPFVSSHQVSVSIFWKFQHGFFILQVNRKLWYDTLGPTWWLREIYFWDQREGTEIPINIFFIERNLLLGIYMRHLLIEAWKYFLLKNVHVKVVLNVFTNMLFKHVSGYSFIWGLKIPGFSILSWFKSHTKSTRSNENKLL